MYDAVANFRTCSSLINGFSITTKLRQGSTLNLFLFIIAMDELTKAIQCDTLMYVIC